MSFIQSNRATNFLHIYSGLATPINDIVIMKNDVSVPPGTVGEVWIRGPNVMKSYWRDQGH